MIISFAKYSVLCFYRRIFGAPVKRNTMVVFVVQTVWMIVCCFELAFRCIPIEASWDPILPAKCQSLDLMIIVGEPLNCILDFIMVALPIRVIKNLQLPVKQKITVSGIFLLGGL